MMKIALLHGNMPSAWISCRSITGNLQSAYRLAFPSAEIHEYSLRTSLSRHETFALAEELAADRPDRICFIDHAPHPGVLLRALDMIYGSAPLPELVFHVFGDFSLHPAGWLELAPVLSKAHVRFICASEKQQRLVRNLITATDDAVSWIPFPVNTSDYFFSAADIGPARSSLGLNEDQFAFVYTGRLSMQKNVTLLLNTFATYLENVDPNAYLFLAGPPDDLGVPYLGFKPLPGWFSAQVVSRVNRRIPAQHRHQVRYVGDLKPAELRSLLHASDCYVSLSTHNDEDFGMAPAEASLCGLPLVLTDWGGFSSFKHAAKDHCHLVPVRIRERAVLPDSGDVLKALIQASAHRLTVSDRASLSENAKALFSIERIAATLKDQFSTPAELKFKCFTTNMMDMARAYRGNPYAPFLSGHGYSETYRRVYGAYL